MDFSQFDGVVVMNTDDQLITAELKETGLWEDLQQSLTDNPEYNLHILADKSFDQNRAAYYLCFIGFEKTEDNGLLSVQVLDPNSHPDVVEVVEMQLKGKFTAEPRLVYIGGGPWMN